MPINDTNIIRISDVTTADIDSIPQIPTYYPTFEEFKDFKKFIYKIEKRGAHHIGLCKVVPPKEWVARKNGYNDLDLFIIPNPISQSTFGKDGVYIQVNKPEKSVNFQTFRHFSYNTSSITPNYIDWDDLETQYWSTFHLSRPIYGANVSGTITDASQEYWNIAALPSILSDVLKEPIGGVNTPYLYFGSWRSTFGWHVEDVDLYSINYLHFGMAKFWYVIPPAFSRRFENLVKKLFPVEFQKCPAFLRHKIVIISPEFLRLNGIPTRKILQEENEFMITFPYGYHSGFNTGLNIAESTNFASSRWIEYGKQALICKCWSDTVKINMKMFVRKFQPHLFRDWLNKTDSTPHPLDLYDRVIKDNRIISKNFKAYDLTCYKNEVDNYSSDEDTDWAYADGNLTDTEIIKDSYNSFVNTIEDKPANEKMICGY